MQENTEIPVLIGKTVGETTGTFGQTVADGGAVVVIDDAVACIRDTVAIGESAGKMYGFIYEGTYKESDFDITTDGNGKKVYTLKDGIASYVKGCQPGDPKYRDIPTIDTNGDGIPDTGDGIINDDDRTTIGDGLPKCTGGRDISI